MSSVSPLWYALVGREMLRRTQLLVGAYREFEVKLVGHSAREQVTGR